MYDLNEKYSEEMTNVLTTISILKFTILFLQYFTICVYIFNNFLISIFTYQAATKLKKAYLKYIYGIKFHWNDQFAIQ